MSSFIFHTHRLLLRFAVVITLIVIALSISFFIQQLDRNIRTDLDVQAYFPVAGLTFILAFLAVPRLMEHVVAPGTVGYVLFHAVICLCGAALVILSGFIVLDAPLISWVAPNDVAPFFILVCAASYCCLAVLGAFRAIWPEGDEDPWGQFRTLRKVHYSARLIACSFAFVIAGTILGSVIFLNSPTTTTTVGVCIVMWIFATLLGTSKLSVRNFEKPISLWNIALQFCVAMSALFATKLTTRAFLFHTRLFEDLSERDAVYPWVENVLMAPFIVFGLTSIVLVVARQKPVVRNMAEVFA